MFSSLHIDITFLLIFETSKLDDEDIVVLKVDLRFCDNSLLSDKCCSSSDDTYSLSLSSLSLFALSSSISIQMNMM